MDAPQNHIWGPALWMILHSSVERIGSQSLARLPQEETRIWSSLLGSLRYSLPCPLCKKHYTAYLFAHPIPINQRDAMRSWLFALHSHVNQTLGVSTTIGLEQLPEIYGQPFHFSRHCQLVEAHMMRSLRLGWSQRNDVQRTFRCLEELKRFYDFF